MGWIKITTVCQHDKRPNYDDKPAGSIWECDNCGKQFIATAHTWMNPKSAWKKND